MAILLDETTQSKIKRLKAPVIPPLRPSAPITTAEAIKPMFAPPGIEPVPSLPARPEITQRPFEFGMDVLRPTLQTLGMIPTPPAARETMPLQIPQWLGVPTGEEQYKPIPAKKTLDIPVSPQISKMLEGYKEWTEKTPSGKYWTGGRAQEDIKTVGTLGLVTSLGAGAVKNLITSPFGQNLISKVANSPTLQRAFGKNISSDKIFEIYTKISRGTAGGKLTDTERKIWDAIQEAGKVIQAQKYGFQMRPFDKGGQVVFPKGLRLPSPATATGNIQFFSGMPIKFKPGDAVKYGDAIYKVSQIAGDTAQLLSTAGNVISARLSELSPAPTPSQIEAEKLMKKTPKKPVEATPEQALIEEAKKFKSAEEFVRGLEYHGTSKAIAEKIRKEGFRVGVGQKGVSTTQDIGEALEYAEYFKESGEDGDVIPLFVKKDAKIIGEEGKDFITGTGSFAPSDIIALPSGTTKQQLTALWQKAQEVPRETLPSVLQGKTVFKPKALIEEVTGIKKKKTPTKLEEEKLLRRELQQEQKAAKVAFRAGKAETRIQEKSRRTGIISGLKDVMLRRVETVQRKGELKLLKEDIRVRDEFQAALSKEKVKRIDEVTNLKRRAELQRLQDDIRYRDMLRVKKELKEYVKENLPKQEQGKFLDAVGRVKTGEQLSREFRRVDHQVTNIERKTVIEGVHGAFKKIAKSRKIDVENQEKVMEIFKGIDFVKRRPETLDRLREMKKVFDKKEELGQDMEIPNRIWRKLEVLLRKPVEQMSVAELKNVRDDMEDLAAVGETKLRVRDSIYKIQKERKTKEIVEGTLPIEKHPLIERQPGEKLPIKDNFQNVLSGMHDRAVRLDIVNTPMDSFFDLMDGGAQTFDGPAYRTFKQQTDTDFQSFMRDSSKDKKKIMDLFNELKLSKQDSELMGVYAAKIQKGGEGKLSETGVTEETIKKAELNEKTERLYKLWRSIADDLKPQIAKVMREEWNLSFDEVENYFPFVTDFEKMSDTAVYNRFGKDFDEKSIIEETEGKRAGKKLKFSFMEKRVGGKQKIQVDFIDVALRHIDNAHYMINMSRTLRMLKEMSNDPKVETALGQIGSKYTKEWLDLLVKKGGRLGDQQIAVLDMLRRNFGVARLGFNISTGLIQVTAIMDAAMILGNDAFAGLNDIIVSQRAREFVLNNMPEVKERAGDDPGYVDFSTIPILKKGQKLSYEHIKFFDRLVAMGAGMGAYKQDLRKRGIEFSYDNVDKKAISYAQQMVRRTQASSLFKDTPPSLRGALTGNRSLDRFINQFQTFMLMRWSNIRNYMFRAKIMGGRSKDPDSRDFKAAFNTAFYLTLAVMTEVAIRRGVRQAEKKVVEFVTGGHIPEKRKFSFTKEFVINMAQAIPFISQGISIAIYRGDFAPALSGVRDIASGALGIATRKKTESKKKAAIDFASGVGGVIGLPGVGQAEKIGKHAVEARTKDSVGGIYKMALDNNELLYDSEKKEWFKDPKAESSKFTDKADKLARESGLSIKRMRVSAAKGYKKEKSNVFSKIEERTHNKSKEDFIKEIKKLIKRGELSNKGADRILELRMRRKSDEGKLAEELILQNQ